MRITTVATLVAAAVIAQVAVTAAQAPPASPPKLEPVVVETSPFPPDRTRTEEEAREAIDRVPGGAEVVGKQTIDESRAANLQDVLQYVPGVLIRPRFGAADESQLSIRGSGLRNNFHLRGINVLIDGFPYGSADGFSDFESLELMDTKMLEVYKGANALRFGANSLGGAVNLISKTGYDEGLLGLRSEAGSFGFFKNHIATGQVYGPLDLYLAYTDTRLDGYRVHGEQTRNRASTSFGYLLPGGTTLRFDWGFTHNEENLPGALTRGQFEANPRQRNPATAFANEQRNYDYTRGGFTVRTPLGDGQVLEGKLQLNYQDLDHPLSFAVIDQTTYNWSTELRYLLASTLFGYASRFTAGMQYFGTRQNDNQFQNLGDAERGVQTRDNVNNVYTLGWYAEEQIDLTPALTLVLGGRLQYTYDSVRSRHPSETQNTDFFGVSPKVGVIYRAAPTVQVYANASRSYEPPLLLELTAPGNIPGNAGRPRRPAGVAVRGRDPRQRRSPLLLGRLRLRHRAVGRDPERERPAVSGSAVHDSAFPEHHSLASHGRGGRRRRAPGRGHPARVGARPDRRSAAAAHQLHLVAFHVRQRPDVQQQRPPRRPRALHRVRAAL